MEHKFIIYSKSERILANETDFVCIKADGAYSVIFLANGEQYRQSDNLKQIFEKIKNKDLFQKVHRSYILNSKMIRSIFKDEARGMKWSVKLENGMNVPVNQDFLQLLKNEMRK